MDSDSDSPILIGGLEKREIRIVDYDFEWPSIFEKHSRRVREALGPAAVSIEHIGSTAVPGLGAKPIVDMLLVVENSADESRYVPQLEMAGYVLRVREPAFYEHRMLRTPDLSIHLHVVSNGCPEIDRWLMFRDRLRVDPIARRSYEALKRRLARREWPDMNAYADAKSDMIQSILAGDSQSWLQIGLSRPTDEEDVPE